ncbi:hypothetical protein ACFV4K_13750 [Nocardia sp. NPDC059764]|uniref:hypothetical protein n=1 Tax=Nocardia sp. NPDC059764 TaxID=3346939 RepID=UPI0036692F18
MTFEFDPLTPEEFDGDLAAASDADQATTDGDRMRAKPAIAKVGDLSALSRHDIDLVDGFLATLR